MGKLEKLLNKVDKYNENGKHLDALTVLGKAMKIAPNNSDVYLSFALTFDLMDRFTESIEFFRKSLEINPSDTNTLTNLGITLTHNHKYIEAVEIFKKSLLIESQQPLASWHLGLTYKFLGLYEDSLRIMNDLASSKERTDFIESEIHFHLGQCYFEMGWIYESINEFRKQVVVNPEDIFAHHYLGNCYFDLGWIDESISIFKNIVNYDPGFIPSYNSLAMSFAEKGWYDDALQVLREAQRIAPDDDTIKNNIDYIESLIDEGGSKLIFILSLLLKIQREKTNSNLLKE